VENTEELSQKKSGKKTHSDSHDRDFFRDIVAFFRKKKMVLQKRILLFLQKLPLFLFYGTMSSLDFLLPL